MTTPRIELRQVSKIFSGIDRAVPALKDVSFKVMPGEFVTIIGASGSGKSTLFNLCVGLLEPDDGEILIAERCGINLSSLFFLLQILNLIFKLNQIRGRLHRSQTHFR